jgi:flagellar protein FliL
MAEEAAEKAPEEGKPKKPIVKILIVLFVVLFVLAGTVGGTLFMTGFFSHKSPGTTEEDSEEVAVADKSSGHDSGGGHAKKADPHAKADKNEKKDAHGKSDKKDGGGPQKKPIPADAQAKFEKSYMELDDKKALVANLANSRKVMQVSLSLMTQYDDRVFQNVEKHRAALRSAALDTLRQVTEAELLKPDFRSELANKLRDRINAELMRLENFGGIEEVFFTEFVYQ